ncbi:MAG: hypothetical protein KGK03_08190, partial [Candidatus Omnitrophica bacterium]|nr:hypothetical protein [Candidatus Omnitrophota bacterium]
RSKAEALHRQVAREQAKLNVINELNKSVQNFKEFQSSLPRRLNEFELATQISKDADQYHINLPSFNSAVPSKDKGIYDVREFGFEATADNFRDAMLFLRKVEKSQPPLKVNNWSGHENPDGSITFDIDISAVHIHS